MNSLAPIGPWFGPGASVTKQASQGLQIIVIIIIIIIIISLR